MRKPCMRTSKRMEHTAAAVSTFHPQPARVSWVVRINTSASLKRGRR